MPAKIVVSNVKGGSRVALLGSSGKELLGSATFKDPRAKGATIRALKGLLNGMLVEDNTLRIPGRPTSDSAKAIAKRPAALAPVAKAAAAVKTTATAARRQTPKSAPSAKAPATAKTAPKASTAKAEGPKATPKVAAARKSTKAATARA